MMCCSPQPNTQAMRCWTTTCKTLSSLQVNYLRYFVIATQHSLIHTLTVVTQDSQVFLDVHMEMNLGAEKENKDQSGPGGKNKGNKKTSSLISARDGAPPSIHPQLSSQDRYRKPTRRAICPTLSPYTRQNGWVCTQSVALEPSLLPYRITIHRRSLQNM